jgi:S1-C subfamily serine protease
VRHVVVVSTPNSTGSGFYIGARSVITNAHVVGAERDVSVKLADGRSARGRVVAVDETRDLALLQTEIDGVPAPLLPEGQRVTTGARVAVIGHPRQLEFSLSSGIVSAVRLNYVPVGGIDVIQTDTALNPGNSGGPLFVGNAVAGVVSFKRGLSEGLGFAVHVNELREFLATAFLQ